MFVLTTKGGLGNALFIFANFIAYAEESKVTVTNPALDEFAGYFQATSQDLFCRYPARPSFIKGGRLTRRLLNRSTYYLTRLVIRSGLKSKRIRPLALALGEELDLSDRTFSESLAPRSLYLIQGWAFKNTPNLIKHAEAVRGYFKPVRSHEESIDELIAEARADCDVLVGVHIRRGDYANFLGGKYFYEAEEYARLMSETERLFAGRRVGFLIGTDSELDEKIFAPFNCTRARGHELEDMYAFARCDYLIGPPSTYTMWASFYGNVPLYQMASTGRQVTLGDFEPVINVWRRS